MADVTDVLWRILESIADVVVVASAVCLPFFYRSVVKPFLNSYAAQKGKQFATHEDYENVLREVRKTTDNVERIRSTILDEYWVKQALWREKRDVYVGLINATQSMQYSLDFASRNLSGRGPQPLSDLLNPKFEEITRLLGAVHLFLAPEAIAAIDAGVQRSPRPQNYGDHELNEYLRDMQMHLVAWNQTIVRFAQHELRQLWVPVQLADAPPPLPPRV